MAQIPNAPPGSWPAAVPANWYPDPSGLGELRYWDGASWASTVAIQGQTYERPLPPPPPQPSYSDSWYAQSPSGPAPFAPGPYAQQPYRPAPSPREEPQPRLPPRAALIALVGFFAGLGASIALSLLGAALGLPRIVRLLLGQAGLWSGLLGACVVVSRRFSTGNLRRDFNLTVAWADVGWGALMSIAARITAVVAVLPLVPFPRLVGGNDEVFRVYDTDVFSLVVVALLAVVGAPIIEELFFRGVLQGAFLDRLGTAGAIAVSSVLFGFAHFNPELGLTNVSVIFAVTGAAVVFGLTVRLRRLGSAIFAHAFFNLVAVAFAVAL